MKTAEVQLCARLNYQISLDTTPNIFTQINMALFLAKAQNAFFTVPKPRQPSSVQDGRAQFRGNPKLSTSQERSFTLTIKKVERYKGPKTRYEDTGRIGRKCDLIGSLVSNLFNSRQEHRLPFSVYANNR